MRTPPRYGSVDIGAFCAMNELILSKFGPSLFDVMGTMGALMFFVLQCFFFCFLNVVQYRFITRHHIISPSLGLLYLILEV